MVATLERRFAEKCTTRDGGFIMTNFVKMLKDDSGAAAAEYALILAVIGAGIIVSAVALGDAIDTTIDCTGDTITTRVDAC